MDTDEFWRYSIADAARKRRDLDKQELEWAKKHPNVLRFNDPSIKWDDKGKFIKSSLWKSLKFWNS